MPKTGVQLFHCRVISSERSTSQISHKHAMAGLHVRILPPFLPLHTQLHPLPFLGNLQCNLPAPQTGFSPIPPFLKTLDLSLPPANPSVVMLSSQIPMVQRKKSLPMALVLSSVPQSIEAAVTQIVCYHWLA